MHRAGVKLSPLVKPGRPQSPWRQFPPQRSWKDMASPNSLEDTLVFQITLEKKLREEADRMRKEITGRMLQQTADRVRREMAEHARHETIGTLVAIMQARFGRALPADVRNRLQNVAHEELRDVTVRAATAASPEDVLGHPEGRPSPGTRRGDRWRPASAAARLAFEVYAGIAGTARHVSSKLGTAFARDADALRSQAGAGSSRVSYAPSARIGG